MMTNDDDRRQQSLVFRLVTTPGHAAADSQTAAVDIVAHVSAMTHADISKGVATPMLALVRVPAVAASIVCSRCCSHSLPELLS